MKEEAYLQALDAYVDARIKLDRWQRRADGDDELTLSVVRGLTQTELQRMKKEVAEKRYALLLAMKQWLNENTNWA